MTVGRPKKWESRDQQKLGNQELRRAAGRDIGSIPQIQDLKRRRRCEKYPPRFLKTYFPHAFFNAFSKYQLEDIETMATAIRQGGLFALAWPRGDGKTTTLIGMIIYAIVYGYRRFIVPIGSDAADAQAMVDNIRSELEQNDLLLADFPEACFPFRALEGRPQKAHGQTCMGEATGIRMTRSMIQFAAVDVEWAKCCGAIIESRGLTGRLRGMLRPTKTGEKIRPDLVVLNDPQTDESAGSRSQNDERLGIIRKAVLGLAGQGNTIAGFALVTIIQKQDLADQLTDRVLNPQWQGVRRKMVYSWPENAPMWDQYCRLRKECQSDGDTLGIKARLFYRRNRRAMDAGSKVGNPNRKDVKSGDISAIEHAYCKLSDLGEDAFNSEYQNRHPDRSGMESTAMLESVMAERCTGADRGGVAADSAYVVGFADLNQDSIHWSVSGLRDDYMGHVIDYGEFRGWWDNAKSPEENVATGLDRLCEMLCLRDWPVAGGTVRRLDKLAIDSGWMSDTVYQFCALSKWRGMVQATKGEYVEAGKQMVAPQRAGTYRGENLVFGMLHQSRVQVRLLRYDADAWKTFLAGRLSGVPFVSGSLNFFGKPNQHHRLFAHLCSESAYEIEARGMRKQKWQLKIGVKENHWLDCLVGTMALASLCGCRLKHQSGPAAAPGTTESPPDRPTTQPRTSPSASPPPRSKIQAKYLL